MPSAALTGMAHTGTSASSLRSKMQRSPCGPSLCSVDRDGPHGDLCIFDRSEVIALGKLSGFQGGKCGRLGGLLCCGVCVFSQGSCGCFFIATGQCQGDGGCGQWLIGNGEAGTVKTDGIVI